jgi:hypothetical protein
MANSVIDPNTGASLEYCHLIKGSAAKRLQQANMIESNRLTDGRLIRHGHENDKLYCTVQATKA